MFRIRADDQIAIIGLGYVGLPLAVEFGKSSPTIGFDINDERIDELKRHYDNTREVSKTEMAEAHHLRFTSNSRDIAQCKVFIVTVPTPINQHKQPDLTPLIRASETIGKIIRPDTVVIYESTVYPGATEEVCIPIIERESGLLYNKEFFAGYSPERINPGDKEHRVSNIMKVTAGSTPEVAKEVDALYQRIITAGTHLATSIKVAEAAKVIENTQRDLNIALINELALIFDKLGIDTLEVLEAAGTKWNFLNFRPGLVGGHCISVDPYYLTHKAQEIGYYPQVILAGRQINDGMGSFIAERVVKMKTARIYAIHVSWILSRNLITTMPISMSMIHGSTLKKPSKNMALRQFPKLTKTTTMHSFSLLPMTISCQWVPMQFVNSGNRITSSTTSRACYPKTALMLDSKYRHC